MIDSSMYALAFMNDTRYHVLDIIDWKGCTYSARDRRNPLAKIVPFVAPDFSHCRYVSSLDSMEPVSDRLPMNEKV